MPLSRIKVLMIEDNANDAELIKEYLYSSISQLFNIIHTDTLQEGFEQLDKINPDVILLDLNPIDEKGSSTFIKTFQSAPNIPIIVLTGQDDMDFATKLVKKGAQDFLVKKNLSDQILVRSIRYAIERKEIELKYQAVEQRWRSILSNLPGFLSATNLDGVIYFVNRPPFGLPKSQVVGKNILDFFDPNYHDQFKQTFMTVINEDTSRHLEAKGSIRKHWFDIRIGPLKNETAEIIGTVVIALDIQHQKEIEEQLKLRQRMDSLGTLASGIAHDFNNILTGIMGNISAVTNLGEPVSETQDKFLRNAIDACRQATELIRQLQFLSTGYISSIEQIDLHDIVQKALGLIEKTSDRLIEKINMIEPETVFIWGNITDIHQVLLNLLTNAVYAIEEKGVKPGDCIKVSSNEVKIKNHDNLDDGDYVQLTVEDTGLGMTDEIKNKVLEPWFTTKSSGKQKGQGLGLAMVNNIVTKNYNGDIEIESQLNKGTKVNIFLMNEKDMNRIDLNKSTNEFSPVIQHGPKHVLIVEDETIIQSMLKTILESHGYELELASDGKDALDIIDGKKENLDLVILDLTLPKLSGKEVLQHLYALDPTIPVIISSGHDFNDIIETINFSNTRFLPKPYSISDLLSLVNEIFELY